MGRLDFSIKIVIPFLLIGCLCGCGSDDGVNVVTTFPTPLIVALSPTPTSSLEVGKILAFTAIASTAPASPVTEPITYQSNNTSVLTISTNGLACAGSWDSLTNPQVCSPGPVGIAKVTAIAEGVSSPSTTVYVHQHIDSVVLAPIPGQTNTLSDCNLSSSVTGLSKGSAFDFQAIAYSRGGGPPPGLDVSSTVGPFSWQATNATVVSLQPSTVANPINGLSPGQLRVTANVPGVTSLYATVNGVSSLPFQFTTCPVESITLSVTGSNNNSVGVNRGGSKSIVATVFDSTGTEITGTFLTWCSSEPASVSVGSANCGAGASTGTTATASQAGGGTAITASCTPPNCNIGFLPLLPIYPDNPAHIFTTGGGTTTATSSTTTAWITTTGCKFVDECVTLLAPVTSTTTSGATTSKLGTLVTLPSTPNSLVFDRQGTLAFLGTDRSQLGTRGLMVLNPTSNSAGEYKNVSGKVLAISPDGKTVILSNTSETPNQVYVFACTSNTTAGGPCGTNSATALNITGATAASFSPDGLKAYIAAGTNLYVYSKLEALKTIALGTPVGGISFLANGAFAYLAGGTANGVTVRRTCDNAFVQDVNTAAIPSFLKALPDGTHLLGVDSPGIDIITASNVTTTACSGTVSNTSSSVNLGQGNFVPTQLLVSSDGSTAFLLTSNVGNVVVFHIADQTTSSIALAGNTLPLQASLSQDGSKLYAVASDGMVHVIDTLTGNDLQQISIPSNASNLQTGLCQNVTLPLQAIVNIAAASQSGFNTTYSYTLTSGPALQAGMRIVITGMVNPQNNGAFAITSLGAGTLTVSNVNGVTAGGQNGTGAFSLTCDPDLIAVVP